MHEKALILFKSASLPGVSPRAPTRKGGERKLAEGKEPSPPKENPKYATAAREYTICTERDDDDHLLFDDECVAFCEKPKRK